MSKFLDVAQVEDLRELLLDQIDGSWRDDINALVEQANEAKRLYDLLNESKVRERDLECQLDRCKQRLDDAHWRESYIRESFAG